MKQRHHATEQSPWRVIRAVPQSPMSEPAPRDQAHTEHSAPRWAARLTLRHRAHAGPRGRLWSALSVALAAVGCAPPGPTAAESATDALRAEVFVGAPLSATVS